MKRRMTDGRTYFDQTYIPLDELLVMPRIRVLRMLRHFDWASSQDIRDVLRVAEHEIANYNTVVSRLVRDGHVDRIGRTIHQRRYRINESGRHNLRMWMTRADLPDTGSSLTAVAS